MSSSSSSSLCETIVYMTNLIQEHKIKMLNTKDISHLYGVKVQVVNTAIICYVLVFWILFFLIKIYLLRPQITCFIGKMRLINFSVSALSCKLTDGLWMSSSCTAVLIQLRYWHFCKENCKNMHKRSMSDSIVTQCFIYLCMLTLGFCVRYSFCSCGFSPWKKQRRLISGVKAVPCFHLKTIDLKGKPLKIIVPETTA